MPADIFVIGTDFHEQTFFDKETTFLFCNPPYSEFQQWTTRLIRETGSKAAFFVIPERWKDCQEITEAIKYRGAEVKTRGSFSFEDAEDRKARAKVDLVEVVFPTREADAFSRFFKEEFSEFADKMAAEDDTDKVRKASTAELVGRPDFVAALVSLYQNEMGRIQANYAALKTLDPGLFKELKIDVPQISKILRERLTGLKKHYWKNLFDNLDKITNRLTQKSRGEMLATLYENTAVDFTTSNVNAIVLWTIKNANRYMESQFIDTYEAMISKANVANYKSNAKVLSFDRWRYYHKDEREENTDFKLEYRLVLEHCGGINTGSNWQAKNGLNERGFTFLSDLATIAANLGFSSPSTPGNWEWETRVANQFTYADAKGNRKPLFEARAFQNQNIHIRLSQEFAVALNTEYGRLKGWLKSADHAAQELQEPTAKAAFGLLQPIRIADASRILGTHATPEAPQQETPEQTAPETPAKHHKPAKAARKPSEPKPVEMLSPVIAGAMATLEMLTQGELFS